MTAVFRCTVQATVLGTVWHIAIKFDKLAIRYNVYKILFGIQLYTLTAIQLGLDYCVQKNTNVKPSASVLCVK